MLPARHRLTESADFRAAVRGSRRRGTPFVVVHARARDTDLSADPTEPAVGPVRVGLVVSKAVGDSVTRHRVARRLRHQVAPLLALLPAGTDVVLRATPAAASASSHDIGGALRHALRDLLAAPDGEAR